MSRRKDQERYESMRRLYPDYRGFRGDRIQPALPVQTPLGSVTCIQCRRKRNIPLGLVAEHGDSYVCQSCQDVQR